MLSKIVLTITLVALAFAVVNCAGGGGSVEPITVHKTEAGEISFSQTVAPILVDHCERCHGEDKKGELYILTYDGVMKGGKSGGFVVPGDAEGSRLITSVKKTTEPFMPPRVFPALTEDRIEAISTWINEGAKDN